MPVTASMLLAFTLSTCPVPAPPGAGVTSAPIAAAVAAVPAEARPDPTEEWRVDRDEKRPAALPALYATLGVLQAIDVYSTRKALAGGAYEANPVMRSAIGSGGATLAVKALSTAGTIYFTERAWKKNRKGAVVLMAAINAMSAAISARNFRNARQP